MNKSAWIFLGWLMAAVPGPGQVVLDVSLEQEGFLRDESLPIKVRVSNSSGQTLHLGQEPDWLTFEIQDSEGRDVRERGKVPLADPFELESAKVASLRTDLMPYFELSRVGRYAITVTLKVSQLDRTFTTKSKTFDIVTGNTLWEREFGLPATGVPETRKYALVQANLLKDLRLYVRVTDPTEAKVFKVQPLGTLLSFSRPETQLDKSSNLHVLFQAGARNFLYLVISPDADIVLRQTYEYYGGSRPALRLGDETGVYVAGGRRRVLLSDLPPPPEEPPAPEPETKPTTNAPPKKATSKSRK
jgi:hypothetical protein